MDLSANAMQASLASQAACAASKHFSAPGPHFVLASWLGGSRLWQGGWPHSAALPTAWPPMKVKPLGASGSSVGRADWSPAKQHKNPSCVGQRVGNGIAQTCPALEEHGLG
jgi:hypothetical protein